jgi:aminomethyltransferase
LVPTWLADLPVGCQRYTVLTAPGGGILDDLMIVNTGEGLLLVVNAARKASDLDHLQKELAGRCTVTPLTERAMLALQGPKAAAVMGRLAADSERMPFLSVRTVAIAGVQCLISRSGYTGEDGYELTVPAEAAERVARLLLAEPEVAPAGLGARDSLRLEAGLCLYGHDIDETTTPVEAGLGWVVSRVYRDGSQPVRFPGADVILGQLHDGAGRRRVGLRPSGRAPVRAGTALVDGRGEVVGRVTSGGFGPSVAAPVAMGYVEARFAAAGTELICDRRGHTYPVRVAALPFVAHRYYRGA